MEALQADIERIIQKIILLDEAAKVDGKAAKALGKLLKEQQLISQGQQLFSLLEKTSTGLGNLPESAERARSFIEKHRTLRLYSFGDSAGAIKFARQLLQLFGMKNALFKPRFLGALDLTEIASKLDLKKTDIGLLLQPTQIKPFVRLLMEKRFASNISLEAENLRLVWQDKKTIAVDAPAEKLYKIDLLCDSLKGKCLEK